MRELRIARIGARPLVQSARVTVVIPCFNYARFLPAAIRSALAQNRVAVDVVVVDDASTDDSLMIARRLADQDPRVRVFANPTNLGPVETFNRGLALAQGEFLIRLDADDMLTPGAVERAVAVMQSLPTVGMVYGHPLHFSDDVLPRPRTRVTTWSLWHGRDWLAARCADGTNVITSPEVVMRRTVVDIAGGQSPLAHTHDMEMWLRLAAHADVAYVNGVDQAWHRDHPASLSMRAQDPVVILAEIRDAFDVLFDRLDPLYPGAENLRAEARRAVARQALVGAERWRDRGQAPDEAYSLLRLARHCDSTLPELDRVEAELGSVRIGGLVELARRIPSRGRRRLREVARTRRWHNTGVYERLHVERLTRTSVAVP